MSKHDIFNTRGGEFGFEVEFADGTRMTEADGTWDDVPAKPIASLAVCHLRSRVDRVRLRGFREFLFSNEALEGRGGRATTHAAKILGGVNSDGSVVLARVEFAPGGPPRLSRRQYESRAASGFSDHAFRPGVQAQASA